MVGQPVSLYGDERLAAPPADASAGAGAGRLAPLFRPFPRIR